MTLTVFTIRGIVRGPESEPDQGQRVRAYDLLGRRTAFAPAGGS